MLVQWSSARQFWAMNRCYLKWYSCGSKDGVEQKPQTKACILQGFPDTNGKNNSKYTVALEIRKWLLQERKRRGNGLETGLMCFTVGVGMFFIVCLVLWIGTGACQLWAQTIWPLMNRFISCCLSPVLRRKTVQIFIPEAFRKERSPCDSLCAHCGICSLLTQYRAEVSSGKGERAPPMTPARDLLPQDKRSSNTRPQHSLK